MVYTQVEQAAVKPDDQQHTPSTNEPRAFPARRDANARIPEPGPVDETGPDSPFGRLDVSLAKRLRSVGSRLRGYVLIEGAAWVAGFLIMAFAIQGVLDYAARGLR